MGTIAIQTQCCLSKTDDEYDDEGNVRHRFSFDREPELFDDVGGVDLWKQLNEELKKGRLGGGSTAR